MTLPSWRRHQRFHPNLIEMSINITAQMVGDLREKTGAGLLDCKKALTEANGNTEDAITLLRKRGAASAAKKAERATREGLIESYIHVGGKVGVMIEVNCETDFVARNDEFKVLCRDLCLQIAAANPAYVRREEVPEADVAKERDIASAQVVGKPPAAIQKIIEGKLEKYYSTICLLDQPFVKLPEKSVKDIITEKIAKIGENIQVRRFVRYQLGA
jgi:elongation factor Ts